MIKLSLCEMDKNKVMKCLNQYTSSSKLDTDLEVKLYKQFRYEGFSTMELAEQEHMSRPSIYRRIRRVDEYLQKMKEQNIE